MREVLLHGGTDESFNRSVDFARRLAETFGARLHVLYTVDEPLRAGWTAEMSAERMPELHQAVEAEARERLSRYLPPAEQERLGVRIALRAGDPAEELVRYARSNAIDLVVLQARPEDDGERTRIAREMLERSPCALLVLR